MRKLNRHSQAAFNISINNILLVFNEIKMRDTLNYGASYGFCPVSLHALWKKLYSGQALTITSQKHEKSKNQEKQRKAKGIR